jgi:hypothetical protein
MPAGPLRDYFAWGLDEARPEHRQFVQATGVGQLVRLYGTLAGGLVDDAAAMKVGELLARIGVYHTYEIITDNLGIGLFGTTTGTAAGTAGAGTAGAGTAGAKSSGAATAVSPAAARRQLVRSFNAAMTVRLGGGGRTAAVLLGPDRRRAARVSTLDHTLAGHTHRRLAGGSGAVEWDLWPALVANVEAAVDVAATADGTRLGTLVRDGLMERYRGVSRTLAPRHLSRAELAAVGAHTVLVAPTLAYCIAVVADLIEPAPHLPAVVEDGTLAEALYDAALLSRLLNDVGPGLLRWSHHARREALQLARREASRRTLPDTADAALAALTGPRFTRLAKDLAYGEFNVCLYAARRAPDGATAFDALESDLDHFVRLYALHRRRLGEGLRRLTVRLADPRPATLVRRFVRFHADLYARPYDQPAGEYAI